MDAALAEEGQGAGVRERHRPDAQAHLWREAVESREIRDGLQYYF